MNKHCEEFQDNIINFNGKLMVLIYNNNDDNLKKHQIAYLQKELLFLRKIIKSLKEDKKNKKNKKKIRNVKLFNIEENVHSS